MGIFHTCFVSYHISNDGILGDLAIEIGRPVPADLWAGLIRDRMAGLPSSFACLVETYRRNKEALGLLASPHERHAWEFLMKWIENPCPALHVPFRLPNGLIR
jgi:hypothetical protein